MDKRSKQRRHKTLSEDELADVTPKGASFDTEEGRAAQGMRPDIGNADRKGDTQSGQERADEDEEKTSESPVPAEDDDDIT